MMMLLHLLHFIQFRSKYRCNNSKAHGSHKTEYNNTAIKHLCYLGFIDKFGEAATYP